MRKLSLAVAIAVLSIGAFVALSAKAMPLVPLPTQNYSAVQKVGCTTRGPRCPLGRTWVCAKRGCVCLPCGRRYYYGAPWHHPLRPWRWRY